tara:strand:+ start:12874 stop:14424 length:1551 start_codon:yes stop_codon:yes gene_type:complete
MNKNLILVALLTSLCVIATPGYTAPFASADQSRVDYTKARYQPKVSCDNMTSLTTTEHTVVSAKYVDGVCRVSGVIPEEIRFEVNLPDNWNGRTLMLGNGGLAGQPASDPQVMAMRDSVLAHNFVSVYSDNGHDSRVEPGASFAHNNIAKLIDYGYRAVHLTQVTAEQLVKTYYRRAQNHSYFMGCSNGGRQALMAAQRFPNDFDGIVAGAPANNFTGLKFSQAHRMRAILDSDMNLNKATNLGKHILAACDESDGLKDRLISDPTQCNFKPDDLPICGEAVNDECYTKRDISALNTFYAAVEVAGVQVYPPFPVGSETTGPQSFGDYPGWMPWVINPRGRPILDVLGSEFFRYIVFVKDNPELVWTDVDFNEAPDNLAFTRDVLDAVDPDLAPFKQAGGKIISYFGWADPDINPLSAIQYHSEVKQSVADTDDFYRLFMVPGMFHCVGGPGPSQFDAFTPLVEWVEKDLPPSSIEATHMRDGESVYTRPLCPHPEQARFDAAGDVMAAASFSCQQ